MVKGTDSLSEQIHLIHIQQQQYIQGELKKAGLNEIQARTINYVFTYPGCIQKDLARYLGKQDASVTNILKLLEKRGYIRREIPADNERQKKIYITGDGEKLVTHIQNMFSQLEGLISTSLADSDIRNAKRILKKISKGLNNL